MVLDEGHLLGAGLAMTAKLQTARALHADRRWIMTGTPTPAKPGAHVAHLQPLLDFLRQQPYGTQRKLWEARPPAFRPFPSSPGRQLRTHRARSCHAWLTAPMRSSQTRGAEGCGAQLLGCRMPSSGPLRAGTCKRGSG